MPMNYLTITELILASLNQVYRTQGQAGQSHAKFNPARLPQNNLDANTETSYLPFLLEN
jgi:hypothetical protein